MTAPILDKSETRIRRMFDQVAPRYDLLNHLLSLNIDKRWRRVTTQLVPTVGSAPMLDLCTGTGDLAFAYDRAAHGKLPIIAADFCHEMLVRAEQKSRNNGTAERIKFVEADAQALPFPDEYFQLVTVSFGLRNVTDPDKGLREMIRVTQPGGRIAVLEFSRPRNPLIGRAYFFGFRHLLPRIGQWISKNKENAYSYLPESVLQFPDGEAMAEKLRGHGLQNVWWRPLTFGIASLYVGEKVVRVHGS